MVVINSIVGTIFETVLLKRKKIIILLTKSMIVYLSLIKMLKIKLRIGRKMKSMKVINKFAEEFLLGVSVKVAP